MRAPWANVLLLVLLAAQAVSGYLALTNGDYAQRWPVWLHGIGAYAIVVLLVWKGQIIADALRRKKVRTNARRVFLALLALLVLALASGIAWTIWGPIYLGGFSLISLHIYLAVPLILLMAWHAWRKRFVLRMPQSRDRRLFLRGFSLAAGGALVWGVLTWGRKEQLLANLPRRFSGSFETGSFTGRFPMVSWIADRPPAVDLATWRLVVGGAAREPFALSYEEFLALAGEEVTAVLDCTGGWYSEQAWRGVRLGKLLAAAGLDDRAASVTFRSLTGYKRRFDIAEAQDFLLATAVAGKPLMQGHGFPARLVAPGYRGYDWVKWVGQIEVQTSPATWQSPLPLQ